MPMNNDQRAIQNRKQAIIRKALADNGFCRCGKLCKAGKRRCEQCLKREAARNAAKYHGKPLEPKKPRTAFVAGVRFETSADGYGRREEWVTAAIMINGEQLKRRWSVAKHGKAGAKMLASLQRMMWMIENGVWKPEDGDPFAAMTYEETFGNRDYSDSVLEHQHSPWTHSYADQDDH